VTQIILNETSPIHGRVRLIEVDDDGNQEVVVDHRNLITDVFINSIISRILGTATARDTMAITQQALGSGAVPPVSTGTNLAAEFHRKVIDNKARSANQIILSTTFSSLEANVPQGRITDRYAGTANQSKNTWTIAPYLSGLSPLDTAYVSSYFKRFREGDLVRIGLGSGNKTYVYANLTSVIYNAAATNCVITISPDLTEYPPNLATVDGLINEAGVYADSPNLLTVQASPAPTAVTFAVDDASLLAQGDQIIHRKTTTDINGATFENSQIGTILSITGNTITLTSPGLTPLFPVNGSSPAPTVTAPVAGDKIWAGRLYNWVSGLRFVKSRQKNVLVETIFTTGNG
jgi:hypothetical protein